MSKVERAKVLESREVSIEILAHFEIAQMSAHDLLEVVEIEETSGLSRWGWDSYNAELSRPESIMLVARRPSPDARGKYLHGFVAARLGADELHVNNIGVREEVRRRGIGNVLLKRALGRGEALGARAAILEVRAGNAAAKALYESLGFEVLGRRRNYYHEPTEDALIMSKPLQPPT
jgi:ribosomal-protein-alanine N-acetyltransferase